MDIPGWVSSHWPLLTPGLFAPLLADRKVRRALSAMAMAVAHRGLLVKENLDLAERAERSDESRKYWEETYGDQNARFDDLTDRFIAVQHTATLAIAELKEMRTIAQRRAESIKRLAIDLEAAKIWGRDSAERLRQGGAIPAAEPAWQSVGSNVLHPEDLNP